VEEKNKCETQREQTGTNTAIKANAGGGSRQHADRCAFSSFYYVRISCRLQSVLDEMRNNGSLGSSTILQKKILLLLLLLFLSLILQLLLSLTQTYTEMH